MHEQESHRDPAKSINRALGLFLLSFGAVILVAVLFTETRAGQLANLLAGLVIAGIGLALILSSRARAGGS